MHPEPTRAGSTGPMRMRCVTWTRRGDAEPMDAFTPLAATFSNSGVLYVVIGAWGANYYAPSGGTMFMTLDRDIFLPADPDNLLAAWHACEASRFALFARAGPLDVPRDIALAHAVVGRRALTRTAGCRTGRAGRCSNGGRRSCGGCAERAAKVTRRPAPLLTASVLAPTA